MATPVHDLLEPKLAALLREAEAAGVDRETAVAVLIDILSTEISLPASGAPE